MTITTRSVSTLSLLPVQSCFRLRSPVRRPLRLHRATVNVEPASNPETKEKYYGTVPGFPGVVIEYDAPQNDKKTKGRFDLKAIILLSGGMVLMLSVVATLLSIGDYL